jgi:hypothetical protein
MLSMLRLDSDLKHVGMTWGLETEPVPAVAFQGRSFYILRTMRASGERLRGALRDIIAGKIVKRSKHELVFEGEDLTVPFIDELQKCGYHPSTVERVTVNPGERIPAFYLMNSTAYFGWVFWEQFTSWKMRKLWGSVLKNDKGDWDIQIPVTRDVTLYANERLKLEMDIEHPPEF